MNRRGLIPLILPFLFVATARAQLELQIDPLGNVSIANVGDSPISFGGYQIQFPEFPSQGGLAANVQGWRSLQEQVAEDPLPFISQFGTNILSIGEANPGLFNLAEVNSGLFFDELPLISPGDSIAIGRPIDAPVDEILESPPLFRYSFATEAGFQIGESCLGGGDCAQGPPPFPAVNLSLFDILKGNFGSTIGFAEGDLNMDGYVGFEDLHAWKLGPVDLSGFSVIKQLFGITPNRNFDKGDFDLDGRVGLEDFAMLKATFGNSASLRASVPEPGTFLLAIIAALACGTRRSWRLPGKGA